MLKIVILHKSFIKNIEKETLTIHTNFQNMDIGVHICYDMQLLLTKTMNKVLKYYHFNNFHPQCHSHP